MSSDLAPRTPALSPEISRLDYLDATRAFALVLGVLFHASLSFLPVWMGWAVQDVSTSPLATMFFTISHSFRMETFFLLAGFFACVTVQRKGAGEFIRSRAIRLGVPFVAGWFLLRPLLVSGWIMGAASLHGSYSFWDGIRGGFETMKTLPAGLFTGSHLWFLYYLAMITALALVGWALLKLAGTTGKTIARRVDVIVMWLSESALTVPLLAIPTSVALWFMRTWAVDTPDQSLTPHLPVLAMYGGCFVLGWIIGRQREIMARFARLSVSRWLLALAGITGTLLLSPIERDLGHPHRLAAHLGYVASYSVTMWSLVFLTLGAFKQLCQRPRAWVRYLADSSYWMYLVHLPIVVWLQVALADAPFNWSLKLGLILAGTVAASLLTYDLFVRSSWIGWVLNGRRRERAMPALFGKLCTPWRGKTLEPAANRGPRPA